MSAPAEQPASSSAQAPEQRNLNPFRAASLPMDPWLFFAAIALTGLGLVVVYSASAWIGHTIHHEWEYYLLRQSVFVALGLVILLACSHIDYRVLRRFAPQLTLLALASLVLVLFIGQEINGARRWIRLGPVNIQPSEIAKVALTVYLAATLARQGERIRKFKAGFLPPMVIATLTMLLVLAEKDLGTTILIGALTLIMLFVAGTRLAYVSAAVMMAAPLIWYQIVEVDYRRGRLEEFMSGDGYQVHQALIAIGSGGPWGLGLGDGRQKLGFLPENHTDFVLATVGEELGLAGIVLVIGLFGLLVWRGLVASKHAPDRFGTYLAAGLSAMFGLQALVNAAVVLEVIPAKGITLPFLSYGGSSLLVSMAAVGLMLSVSRRPASWRMSDQRRGSNNGRADPTRKSTHKRRRSGPPPNVRNSGHAPA